MAEDTPPENLRKFLESDDPALIRMGISMAKTIDLPEEIVIKIFEVSVSDEVEENREAANELLQNNYNKEHESMRIAYQKISQKSKELKQRDVVSNHLFQDTKLWFDFQKEFNSLFETLKNERIRHLFLDDLIELVHYEGCLDNWERGVWADSSDLNYFAQGVVHSIKESTRQSYDECKGLTIREVYEKRRGKSVPWTMVQIVKEFIRIDNIQTGNECEYCGNELDGGNCIECEKEAIGNFDFFGTSDIEQLCSHPHFKNFRMPDSIDENMAPSFGIVKDLVELIRHSDGFPDEYFERDNISSEIIDFLYANFPKELVLERFRRDIEERSCGENLVAGANPDECYDVIREYEKIEEQKENVKAKNEELKLEGAEFKIIWREEDKTKIARGKITNEDENFVYLTDVDYVTKIERGTVIVNKKDIISMTDVTPIFKIIWREEDKQKYGRGKITNEDEKFLHLTGERGTVIVNKKDIISMKNVTPL